MKIETFIKVYNLRKTDEEKLKAVSEIMKNEKISFATKVDRAGLIARESYHSKKIGADGVEREVFEQNSAAKYMLYTLTLVDLYTSLDIEYKDSLEIFEKLNGELLDIIVSLIDEREKKEFNMLLDFACDDLVTNEYEPHAFIREQVDRFASLFETIILPAIENLDLDKVKDAIITINK